MLEVLAALFALVGGGGYALALAVSAVMAGARGTPMRWRPPWWALIALGTAVAAFVFESALSPALVIVSSQRGGDVFQSVGLLVVGLVIAIVGGWRGAVARWRPFGEFEWTNADARAASEARLPEPFRGNAWPSASAPPSAPRAPLSAEARAELAKVSSPRLRERLEALMTGRNRPDRAERMAIAKVSARIGVACLVVAATIVVAIDLAVFPPRHPFALFAVPGVFVCCAMAVVAFARAAWYSMRI